MVLPGVRGGAFLCKGPEGKDLRLPRARALSHLLSSPIIAQEQALAMCKWFYLRKAGPQGQRALTPALVSYTDPGGLVRWTPP